MLPTVHEYSDKQFKPHDELAGLEEASLNGDAYRFLKQFNKKLYSSSINKVFQQYFRMLQRQEARLRDRSSTKSSHTYTPTTLKSKNHNEFELACAGQSIHITLGNEVKLSKSASTIEVRLSVLPTYSEVQDKLDTISREPVKRKRRSLLSEYYLDCCMLNDVDPVIKYPHGNEEKYKKLIKDVCCKPIKLVV